MTPCQGAFAHDVGTLGAAMREQKNPWIAAGLGFLAGPFGVLYVSIKQALIGFGVCVALLLVTWGIATPIVPFMYAVWGFFAATKHNEALAREQRVGAERLAAHLVGLGQLPGAAPDALGPPSTPHLLPGHAGSAQSVASPCPSCGTPLRSGAQFCGGCGHRLEGAHS